MIAAGMPATAVVLGTDRNAIGLMAGFRAAGYRLPRDLAVVGFDDIGLASYTSPSLSSVRQSLNAIGEVGYGVVSAMVGGGPAPERVSRVPTEFVQRDSCGCPSVGTAGERAPGPAAVRGQPGPAPDAEHAVRARHRAAADTRAGPARARLAEANPRHRWLSRPLASGPDQPGSPGRRVLRRCRASRG